MKKSIQNGFIELLYVASVAMIILIINKHCGFEHTVITALILILAKIYRK